MGGHSDTVNENTHANIYFVIVTTIIFGLVSFTFLFPCNPFIPLDRCTVAAVGAALCYVNSTFLFPSHRIDLLHAVDFDVLILLASIMIINHIVVHLEETKKLIDWFQKLVKSDPKKGFWIISFVAFIVSPFLTNDGVCLLFVEPILRVFEELGHVGDVPAAMASNELMQAFPLTRNDAIYFLLALACSTNIGSALTYTGNPQNMIVASDALSVMPSYKFLVYMLLPSVVAWLITNKYIEYCWIKARSQVPSLVQIVSNSDNLESQTVISNAAKPSLDCSACDAFEGDSMKSPILSPRRQRARDREKMMKRAVKIVISPLPYVVLVIFILMIVMIFVDLMPISGLICMVSILMVLTIVFGNYWQSSIIWQDYFPISTSNSNDNRLAEEIPSAPMTSFIPSSQEVKQSRSRASSRARAPSHHSRNSSLGNELRTVEESSLPVKNELQKSNQPLSLSLEQTSGNPEEEERHLPYYKEDRVDNLNDFFDELFKSIDYSLLLIFLGTFIVIESMATTGIPRIIWKNMVGKKPFRSFSSVACISAFVLIASQLLGNVAVVQLAKPNVETLGEEDRRFAWSVIAFISTIGGNLTITGSAANIIVAEKANRMDATIALDFFKHYKVCFWITLACCFISGGILSLIVLTDNANGSAW